MRPVLSCVIAVRALSLPVEVLQHFPVDRSLVMVRPPMTAVGHR
jgi:hypothetical protein